MDLVPGMFDESDSNVAKGWRELGANPSPSDLLVGVVACPENASVESEGDHGSDVSSVECALRRMLWMVSADMAAVERVATTLGVDGEGVGRLLCLPLLDQGVYGVNEAVLWDRVEKANKVIVGGVEIDVNWGLEEIGMEMAPQLRNGMLAWMLWEEVLGDDVKCAAGDAKEVACQGVKVGDDGATLLPLFFGLEVSYAIGDREVFAKSPFVTSVGQEEWWLSGGHGCWWG